MAEEKLMMKALSMDIITAKMFTELHLSITEQYGEHGRELVQQGLQAFGLKDAEAMAKKATAEGENHTFFEYLPQIVEGQEQYADLTTFARFSKMFAQIAKPVVDEFGEEGEQVIMRAVERFGNKRGAGIAQRARTNGLENSLENYLTNYDMGRAIYLKLKRFIKKMRLNKHLHIVHLVSNGRMMEWVNTVFYIVK